MKDLRQTSVDIQLHIKSWSKILWKSFLLTAVAAGAFLTAAFALLMPYGASNDAMVSFVVGSTLVQLAPVLIIAITTAVAACILGVLQALKAHRKVCNILKKRFPPKDLTRQQSSVLWVEITGLMLLLSTALSLPLLALMLSAVKANHCSILLDELHTPCWPFAAMFLISTAATVLLMASVTFARACFRNLSPHKATAESGRQ